MVVDVTEGWGGCRCIDEEIDGEIEYGVVREREQRANKKKVWERT